MFGKIAAFELRYQLRQPVFYVVSFVFFLLCFGLVASENVSIGTGGNVNKNAPAAIAQAHLVFSIFFMLVTAAFVANVVIRDDATGYGPIVRSTPIRKFDYLFGRFTGAFGAVLISFLAVPLGLLVGTAAPWVDGEALGDLRLGDYVHSYLLFGVPGLLLSSAIFFALATATRSMMATYLGVVALLVLYLIGGQFLSRPDTEAWGAYADPFGSAAMDQITEYWTAAERNTRNVPVAGALLVNRLLTLGVSLGFLVLAYSIFRFETRGKAARKKERLAKLEAAAAPAASQTTPLTQPRFGAAAGWAVLVKRTRFEMAQVFKSPAFFVLLLLGVFLAATTLWFSIESQGRAIYPRTRVMIPGLEGGFGLILIIIATYYAGELVWRERDRRVHEITDSTAMPDWAFVVPKFVAIVLVLMAVIVAGMFTGIGVQLAKGYTDFEVAKYLWWYVAPNLWDAVVISALAIFVQAMSPHKFVGWGVMVLYFIATVVLANLGFDHNLYNYNGSTPVPLSDMNGQGDFARFRAWFDAYWTAFAVVLLVLSYGLWRRGTETRFKPRLRRLPRRLAGPAGAIGGLALLLFAGLGGYIYLNTNVWNEYRNRNSNERWAADYEKTLLRYETVPQPVVTDVRLTLDLDPHAPRLVTQGVYVLENRTDGPLREVHLRSQDRDLEITRLEVAGARRTRLFERFDYSIFTFDRPLAPGERREVRFTTVVQQRGFKNADNITTLVDNGTFINNGSFAPSVGMDRGGGLQERSRRRKYGLPAELRPAKLGDERARGENYIHADWVNADITVTTVADQTPIAPGYKVSDVTRNGRRTARFVTEAPILHFFSVQSAEYAEKVVPYKGVNLAIFHHPGHAYNVNRMITALKTGLDYYQSAFGPYQFKQARIIEFPAYADFAQAFANTMPYSENLGFIARYAAPEKIDMVTYITAHELGHQWWAHQIVGADMQGSTALSETLAQYSALMVMEKLYGPDNIRRFLKFELDSYLGSRGSEVVEELPLIRVENQGYIHYRKGSLVMYLLKDRMGEDAVNRALRRVLDANKFKGAPYPTSVELVRALRAEAGPENQALITDLFERITLYDVKTTAATSRKRPDGRWDVSLTVEAKKLYAGGKGVETEAPLMESFDVGLFAAEVGDKAFDAEDVILFERRPIRTGKQTLSFTVAREPKFAGVDPYNKRIDRNSDDNLKKVG